MLRAESPRTLVPESGAGGAFARASPAAAEPDSRRDKVPLSSAAFRRVGRALAYSC
ncbi:hypothetical protein HK405_013420, partial [Cladochytrium tenue]